MPRRDGSFPIPSRPALLPSQPPRFVKRIVGLLAAASLTASMAAHAQEEPAGRESFRSPAALLMTGRERNEALRVNDFIYLAVGFGNTAMIVTDEGNVLVDTSLALHAPRHKELLTRVSEAPIRAIILTHGHADHRGGVRFWKQEATEVIAHRNYEEFIAYQSRLQEFFRKRNAAQFRPLAALLAGREPAPAAIPMEATRLVDDVYKFTLGGVRFELHHTPGETPDHLSVWLPDAKVAFIGDNYYASFPNLYSLRGTKPRWALDYVRSLDKIIAWEPEILVLGHGLPLRGADSIRKALTRYRDAIQYVHDAVVAGMNQGRDVYSLMREIRLPPQLDVGEAYGRLSWSVRGIYEGYAGWFDGEPAHMYPVPEIDVAADVVDLAGGPGPLLQRARQRLAEGEPVRALHLARFVLRADPDSAEAWRVRLDALEHVRRQATNVIEMSWLSGAIDEARQALARRGSETSAK